MTVPREQTTITFEAIQKAFGTETIDAIEVDHLRGIIHVITRSEAITFEGSTMVAKAIITTENVPQTLSAKVMEVLSVVHDILDENDDMRNTSGPHLAGKWRGPLVKAMNEAVAEQGTFSRS